MSANSDEIGLRPAIPDDASATRALVRAAYQRYVPRMGREPAPMLADSRVFFSKALLNPPSAPAG